MSTEFQSLTQLPQAPQASGVQLGLSLDRTVERFFVTLGKKPFTYRGKRYEPKGVAITRWTIARSFQCLPNCGACCWASLSREWLPHETLPEKVRGIPQMISVEINGEEREFLFDLSQTEESTRSGNCRYLNLETGRCSIHPKAIGTEDGIYPMVCSLFPFNVKMFESPTSVNRLLSGHVSRPWLSTQIDGTKGVKCYYDPEWPPEVKSEQIWSLKRLLEWAEYCGIETFLPEIIDWIERDMPTEQFLGLVTE